MAHTKVTLQGSGEINWLPFFDTLSFFAAPLNIIQLLQRLFGAMVRWNEPSLLDTQSIILPQTGLTWFNHHIGHAAYVVRWWNRPNLLSLIPYHHSFLEPFDVIQPLPSNVDLVKLLCQLWWASIWWLAFTCDSHSAVSYLWYFRLNTTTAAQPDDKEKNQQLWALSYSDTLCRQVSIILQFSKSWFFLLKH